ncbi:MAG: hypothetical protein AJITA_00367 [Acetilactobacillus jinshanensis]
MANKQHVLEITPGSPKFNKMVYRMIKPVNDDILQSMDYGGNHLQEIQTGVFAMPVYVKKDFNLFMIVGKLVAKDWVAVFSQATIKHKNEVTVTDLSNPFPTGKGLNMLGAHDPKSATHLLKYFQTLVDAKYGEWRLVK